MKRKGHNTGSFSSLFGVMVAIIVVAIGGAVGLAIVSYTSTTFSGIVGNSTMTNTTSVIYTSWPLLGLAILGVIGAATLTMVIIKTPSSNAEMTATEEEETQEIEIEEVESKWECQYCGAINKDYLSKCDYCGAPRKRRKVR